MPSLWTSPKSASITDLPAVGRSSRRRLRRTAGLLAGLAALALLALVSSANAARTVAWIASPSGNIECQVADGYQGESSVLCQTERRPQSVTMSVRGRVKICRGSNCLSNGPAGSIVTLRYGKAITVGRFQCVSTRAGMRCVVRATGHGFVINRDGVVRI